jgi:4-amino-4-deoxy-L-arabinose transferase-like glycosyltransferase
VSRTSVIVWIILGCIALAVARVPSVVRTQEGRVLVTARQMEGTGLQGRLVPHLNERPRLQKPPLAYWLSDLSFHMLDSDSAGAGRVPFVIAAWLTAGLNLLIGTRLFGPRAGTFAMAGMIGSVLGARYGLLAETDVLTMLGVTAAVCANWFAAEQAMAREEREQGDVRRPSLRAVALLFQAGAVATALTILAKGPQGAFPVLFLIALAAWRRRWSPVMAWLRSGALLTLLAIASPWFVYIFSTVDYATVVEEIRVASLGGEHRGTFLKYLGYLPVDALPWTAFVALGVGYGVRRARRDHRLAGLLLWAAVILLPLCLAGQKQRHYLMPLMPPLMLLAGWYVDRAVRAGRQNRHPMIVRSVTLWTAVACGAAGVALPAGAWMSRHTVGLADGGASMLLLMVALGVLLVLRRRGTGRAVTALACFGAATMLILQNVWAPTLPAVSPRVIAHDVATTLGERPVQMLGRQDLPLMFELRAAPRALTNADEVAQALERQPDLLIVESRRKGEVSQAPPTLVERLSYVDEKELITIFEARR